MEEEKAAAYYSELLDKGRNAALFKQGLGFGGGSARSHEVARSRPLASSAKYGMIGFVGAGKATQAEEARPGSEPAGRDGDGEARTSLPKQSPEDGRSRWDEMDGRGRRGSRDRARSPSKERHRRHEIRGSSPRDGRHRSRSRSRGRTSGSRSKRSRSRSPLRKRSRQDRHRSRSRSRDRSHRDGKSRSRGRSRDRSRRRHRERRSRSRSRSSEADRRRRSKSGERSRRDYEGSRDDDRQLGSTSGRRQDSSRSSPSSRQKRSARRVEREQDWAKLIAGFDSMTPAEKVKAKMKLQLSQTVVRDSGKGVEEEWERFDFNKDAPLDDDAKQDYFGDGSGAPADMALIDNIGGSHLFITEQAKREARLQAAHEDAIFGGPVVVEENDTKRRSNRRERERSDSRNTDDDGYEDDDDSAAAKVCGVVSEQIIALQAGSSWQERIKKMRAAQAQEES